MKFPNLPSTDSRGIPSVTFLRWATAVLLLAAFFRLYALQDVPPGLAQDEILDADIASFIRHGENAFFFREGYGHEPLYHYLAVPFAPLLGDNYLASRLPSVYLGMVLVALCLRWAKREFGGVTAVATGALLAVSWWPVVFSRLGIRPISEPVVLLLMAWCWPRRPWLAGFFLGLCFYTYTGARVLFLLPLLLLFLSLTIHYSLSTLHSQLSTIHTSSFLKLFSASLFTYLPMGLTLWLDPTLQQRLEQLDGPLQALRQGNFQPIFASTAATLGVFSFTGDPRWTYTLPHRPLFGVVTAVLFYTGLFLALRHIRQPRFQFILAWLAITLIPSAITPDAPSTVRLVGAIPVVYLLPALAFASLLPLLAAYLPAFSFRSVLYASSCTLLLLVVARTWLDGFVRWPSQPDTFQKYQTTLLEMAYKWREAPPLGPPVLADAYFEPIDADSFRRDVGVDPQARWVQTGAYGVAGAVVFPGGRNGRFYVPEYAPVPPDLLAVAGINPTPIYRNAHSPFFAIYQLPPAPNIPLLPTPITLENKITLLGYTIAPLQNQEIQVFTYWRVEDTLPADLASFMHLLGPTENILAQYDGLDAAATTLQPGDTFVQKHTLLVPDDVPAETASLQVGFYLRNENRRLLRPLGDTPPDRIILALLSLEW